MISPKIPPPSSKYAIIKAKHVEKGSLMIKLLALDMDGTLLNEAKEIPQAHITAIHQAIEKGSNWFSVRVAAFGVLPTIKTGT